MDCYSTFICESCNSKLSEFADFQSELIENQMMLYEHFPCHDSLSMHDYRTDREETDQEAAEEEPMMDAFIKVEPVEEGHDESLVVENLSWNTYIPPEALPKHELFPPSSSLIWTCIQCGMTFSSRGLQQAHMRIHGIEPKNTSKSGKRKICELCGLDFAKNGWYHHVSNEPC